MKFSTSHFQFSVFNIPLATAVFCLSLSSCSDYSRTDPNALDLAWVDGIESSSSSSSASIPLSNGSSSSLSSSFSGSSSLSSSSSTASVSVVTVPQTCTYSSTNNSLACTDGITYSTVTIASGSSTQTWMAQNLNVGTMVPGSASSNQANDAAIEKYCYDDDEANCATDGGLYQWSEAMGFKNACNSVFIAEASCEASISIGHHQGICPSGWHIPKTEEWDLLATMLEGSAVAGRKMKLNSGYSSWDGITTNNDGNSSGFSALPAGFRGNGGGFGNRGLNANFWEALDVEASFTSYRFLSHGGAELYTYSYSKACGLSVRCLRDD